MKATPRIVISSPASGSGKTTVTLGIMAALVNRRYKVQPFKVGPDFIDPSFHTVATNRPSRNLDVWLTSEKSVQRTFIDSSSDVDIAVVEGVMGLYDGMNSLDNHASTAHVAALIDAPVLLVVDVHGMARSVAALIHGFQTFSRNVKIPGVILNRVGSLRHVELAKQAIEKETGARVLGGLPENNDITLPERHLGLVPASETKRLKKLLSTLGDFVEANLELDKIIQIARHHSHPTRPVPPIGVQSKTKRRTRIGVAYDQAFSFYYPENFSILEASGAEIVKFSPLVDTMLPENIDGLYFGGGYPEVFAAGLEANSSLRNEIRQSVQNEMPVYAECGGLMYLTDKIKDFQGRSFSMIGVLSGTTEMTPKLQALGYTLADTVDDNVVALRGRTLRGHEFHYSRITDVAAKAKFAYLLKKGKGIADAKDGWMEHATLASYMHMHFGYDPKIAERFVQKCEEYSRL